MVDAETDEVPVGEHIVRQLALFESPSNYEGHHIDVDAAGFREDGIWIGGPPRLGDIPGVQIIWSNSRCRLHTSAALQLQLFVSDLPLNQSEYTADTLSSNQNRVDHRKWNFNVIFTMAHL